MNTQLRRIQQLEAVHSATMQVYAFYVADADAYQVVHGAPPEKLPAALFWQRYPTACIVKTLAAAAMWGEL